MRQTENRILLLLSICFLAGGILGCLAEICWLGEASAERYLMEMTNEGIPGPVLWRELWIILRWPVFALAAAGLPLSRLTVPVLFCLRGLFLSWGISAFMTSGSGAGKLAGVLIFGPTCLLALPVFFLLGVEGLRKKTEDVKSSAWLRRAMVSIPLLILCVTLDWRVTPALLSVLLKLNAFS